MRVLILVDLQNDFLPGGALAVSEGDHIIPIVNHILTLPFDLVIATKDWHPADHKSFADNHKKEPGAHVMVGGIDQILWPRHCVQGTWGSEFAPGWNIAQVNKVIYKGINPKIDSYSAFFDNQHQRETELEAYLRDMGVKNIYLAGLATDYCVKYSVLDAISLGFNAHVILEACKGVNLEPEDSAKALQVMQQAGAHFVSFKDL